MNSWERFVAFAKREPIDRPLRRAGFVPDLAQRLIDVAGTVDLGAYFDMDEFYNVSPQEPPGFTPPDYRRYYPNLPADAEIDRIGVAHKKGSLYHFTEYVSPLKNVTALPEIESFPIENFTTWDTSGMAAEVSEYHAQGRIVQTSVGHIYESAWQIRGYEKFLMDLMDQPEWAQLLLDRLTERALNLACAGARAGVDLILCGDDVANQQALMFSPETWRRVFKPCWARVWTAVREINPAVQIFYHSDGNIEPIIDDLFEIGVTILNPLQPECMNLGRIAQKYGQTFLFDGGMGTQSVFPFGTPAEVRASVRERVRQFGQNLILSPTHVLEPEVPIENIQAFFDECNAQADSKFFQRI